VTANVKVEVAFADGAMAASPTWTDVSAYVDLSRGITLNRGRGRTATQAEPGRCSLTLNNDDGRFTWGDPAGAYGLGLGDQPQLRQPLRVSADFGSGYRSIWTGYVDEWAGGWDGGMRPVVRVTASDRVSRLQLERIDDPAIASEILSDNPVAYYPLDEPAGSVSAGSRAGDIRPLSEVSTGNGLGTIDFGIDSSPDGERTVVTFTQDDGTNGKRLAGQGNRTDLTEWTVECWILTTSRVDSPMLLSVNDSAHAFGVFSLLHSATSPDVLWASHFTASGFAQIQGTIGIDDSAWHHVVVTCDASTMTLYVDNVSDGTDTAVSPLPLEQVNVGGGWISVSTLNTDAVWDGKIAHVAVYDSVLSAERIEQHYRAGWSDGPFSGDTADERFTRLCRLAGLPSALYASDATATTVLGAQPLDGVGLMDAILQVTDSERGVAYVDGAGVLTYLSSASVSGLTSALTLGPSDVDQDVTLTTNDQELVNDVTVTRPGGATQRRADQASIDSIGQAATTVDTLLSTDAAAGALADLLLSQGLVVHPRTDDLVLDLRAKATTIDADAAVALDTGSRVTVAGLPDGAPASTLELMVTGVAHRISHVAWDLTLTVTPLQTLPPWELGDATLGVLGSTTRLGYP